MSSHDFAIYMLVSLVFIFIFLIFFSNFKDSSKPDNTKIDLVYTWYNSTDEDTQEERQYFQNILEPRKDSIVEERFTDIGELKYSLRGVEKYMPWINKIFIVVADNQPLPDWLDISNTKIRIVRHGEIFDSKYTNPTFNSVTIESALGNIKDLNEHFIYFNDDIFVNGEIGKSSFFYNKKPIIWFSMTEINFNKKYKMIHDIMEKNALSVVKKYCDSNQKCINYNMIGTRINHFPKALTKTLLKDYENEAGDRLNLTKNSKFRCNECMYTISGASNLCFQKTNCFEGIIPSNYMINLVPKTNFKKVENSIKNVKFFCLNNSTKKHAKELIRILEKNYPQKSKFEK
jgi:hypothetical protein